MANVNRVIIIGNLTSDPELRQLPNGNPVGDLRLATSRKYTTESGEQREESTFVDVVLWGRQAEIANQYLEKGSPVYIEGRLQQDQWEDKKTGEKRSKLVIVGERMQFLSGNRNGNRNGSGSGDQQGSAQGASAVREPAAAMA